MAYLNRFYGDYQAEMSSISSRIDDISRQAEGHTPADIDSRQVDDSGEVTVPLEWVKVEDPRWPDSPRPDTLEVQPVLRIGWVEDGSGFESQPGVVAVDLLGRLTSGESRKITTMGVRQEHDTNAPELCLYVGDETKADAVAWESADADLLTSLIRSAFWQQPK